MWREGEKVILDFAGTDPQSQASINFFLNENMFKMFFGIYMIMVFDPQILFNDGFYDLIDVRIPEGSLLKPKFPAALSGRTHALAVFSIFWAACWARRPPNSSTPPAFRHRRTCSIRAMMPRETGFSCSRSALAAFPADRWAMGRMGIRSGRALPTCRTSFWNAISR